MVQRERSWLPYVLAFIFLFSGIAFAATMKSIQIKKGVLRSSPSFLGKVIGDVSYGDRVEAVESKSGWSKVKPVDSKKTGWIHDSALTHKKIILSSGQSNVSQSATSDEIALAGKGFNEQVEREMREKFPQMNYSSIDKMEKNVVSDSQMRKFLKEGRVETRGGAE